MPDYRRAGEPGTIKSALQNSGFGYPNKSVTINLAPANIRKGRRRVRFADGAGDSGGDEPDRAGGGYLFVGELSLDGAIRPIRGAVVDCRLRTTEGITNLWFR